MNLKEFDAKQFLLEKGEQVGLGIALTLMVLMLIFSLFMPSKGFFSGSPAEKAAPLTAGAEKLQRELATRQPSDKDKPPETKGRLIDLETDQLQPRFYETGSFFEPTAPENPDRRPPEIFNLVEAIAQAVHVPIDTYIFGKNYNEVMVLRDPEKKVAAGPGPAGGNNPIASIYKGASPGGMMGGAGMAGGANPNAMRNAMSRFKGPNAASGNVQGASGREDYNVAWVQLTNLNSSEHLARQLQPARMAIIAGGFPYKKQLEEFKNKLRLDSVQAVLNETIDVETEKDKKEKLASFRFVGVDVQRMEVDANGKTVKDWENLDLAAPYKVWLLNSSLPFAPDDEKYDVVKFDGLVMPRLREFHEESQQKPLNMMMPGMSPGGSSSFRPGMTKDEPAKPAESKYPDLAGKLETIAETLKKLAGVSPKKIAAPPAKFRGHESFNPFSPNTPAPAVETTQSKDNEQASPGDTIPEYCLVRLVDLDIQPGKFYRYRFKVRMANPNYARDDVASTAYKSNKELVSGDWYTLKDTVSVPPETIYYVVDQKQLSGKEKPPIQSPQAEMWKHEPSRGNQIVFQLHRWIESAPIDKKGEPVPIGEWAIADRVFVARGEFIGQTVKVDLPVWKYTQDAFVLPAEDQSKKAVARGKTGVSVNFGQDNSDTQTILVDFEGGKESVARISDNAALEVLMMSPDGKLHARNSVEDASDPDRQKRREMVQQRIKNVREGKAAGAGGGGSGLDPTRGK